MPPRARPPAPACVGSARRARLRAVTTGLYRSRTRAAFSPPLTRLKGRNAGSSSAATASRGYPMYRGAIK